MPPIQGQEHGVVIGHGRGRQPTKIETKIKMRILEERLETMEIKKNSDNSGDSDEEAESKSSKEEKKIMIKLKY